MYKEFNNQLVQRRKHPSPQMQIYEKVLEQMDQHKKQCQQQKLQEFKNHRDLEQLVYEILQPCKHIDGCIHEQLFIKNQQQKTFRQVCEFRVDWVKCILKSERNFERSLLRRKLMNVQLCHDIAFQQVINSQSIIKVMIDKSKKDNQFLEYAKRFAITYKQKTDYSESLLTQFEDIQNRKKYVHPPSFWSILDCSCNSTVI